MKKKTCKIGLIATLTLLTTAALAVNLLAAASAGANPMTNAPARYLAQTTGASPLTDEAGPITAEAGPITGGQEPLQEPLQETGPCGVTRANEQINESPLTTVSDTCAQSTVSAGTIALDYLPNSFSFPIKAKSDETQNSFSNDYEGTEEIDVATGAEDILTVHDYRNNGGFSVTITSSKFESSFSEIPLSNLYVATTYPDIDDFDILDMSLNGTEINGIEYAAGSNGAQDITANAFTGADLNLPESYTVSFDGNDDTAADIVELMNTSSGHIGRFSQALNFHLRIPADQPAGSYQVKFTVDLITE